MKFTETESNYGTTLCLVTYATEKDFLRVVEAHKDEIESACYIVHDKDETDTHIHAPVVFKQSMSIKRVRGWFKACVDHKGEVANTLAKPVLSAEGMEEYLTHDTEKAKEDGKHQYVTEDIKVLEGIADSRGRMKGALDIQRENAERKAKKKEEAEESNDEFLTDLLKRKPQREMARKYGRDYMKNYKQYKQFAWEVEIEEGTKTIDDYMESADCVIGEQIQAKVAQAGAFGFQKGAVMALQEMANEIGTRVDHGESYLREILKYIAKIEKNYIQ